MQRETELNRRTEEEKVCNCAGCCCVCVGESMRDVRRTPCTSTAEHVIPEEGRKERMRYKRAAMLLYHLHVEREEAVARPTADRLFFTITAEVHSRPATPERLATSRMICRDVMDKMR
jgi:hypothetical protein